MKMHEWDEAGLEPLFGHQEPWLTSQIEELAAIEVAAYASATPVAGVDRLLVATDLGLVDAERSFDTSGLPILAATLVPWPEVEGVRLRWEARLDRAFRARAVWRLEIAAPMVSLGDPVRADALRDLWRACLLHATGAVKPKVSGEA